MNTLMPCGLEDDRIRFEPDAEEDEDILTPLEKRLGWVCDMWGDALKNDNGDEWADVGSALYGAAQTLVHCVGRYDDGKAIRELSKMAFENRLECIRLGKYEGATK